MRPFPSPGGRAAMLYRDPSNSVDDICREFRISPRTLHRYLRNRSTKTAGRKPKTKTGSTIDSR